MSVTAATLRRLAALSLSSEQLAAVIEIVAEIEEANEARKAKQRERRARSRSGHGTVTGQERDGNGTVPRQGRDGHRDNPPKETSPTPPKETTPLLPAREKLIPNVAPSHASGAARLDLVSDSTAGPELELPAILDRRSYPDDFEALWYEYRPIASPNSTKADAYRAWAKLSQADRQACWSGLVRYVVWVGEDNAKRAVAKRSPVEIKHLATFINRRGWEPFMEGAERATG